MIHDAIVEVTCDNDHCYERIDISQPSQSSSCAKDDARVEKELRKEEWVTIDGKHYCSQPCFEDAQ